MFAIKEPFRRALKLGEYKPYVPKPRDILWDASWHYNSVNRESGKSYNGTAWMLERNPEIRLAMGRALEKRGIRYLPGKPFFSGNAIATALPARQVYRVVHVSREGPRPGDEKVLQPHVRIDDFESEGFRNEILPLTQTDTVRPYHIDTLVSAFAKQGLLFWDIQLQNVGRLFDGTPVVIDAGVFVPEENMHKPSTINPNMTYIDVFGMLLRRIYQQDFEQYGKPIPQEVMTLSPHDYYNMLRKRLAVYYNWTNKQEAHLKFLRLEKGTIAGVFSDEDIKGIVKSLGGKYNVLARGLLDGANREDLRRIVSRASDHASLSNAFGNRQASWHQSLQHEFAEFKKELPPQGIVNEQVSYTY